MSENTEMKEYFIRFSLAPRYNKECNESFYYFPSTLISVITFKIIYLKSRKNQQL
jgi:hypothetical protein